MSGFYQIEVIVEGALEVEREIDNAQEYDEFIEAMRTDALDGKPTDIYVLWHNHEPLTDEELDAGGEDVCIQYEQDLRPLFSWNNKDDA